MNANAKESWWVRDFQRGLAEAQARMRREPCSPAVEDYFERQLQQEEAEVLGHRSRTTRSKTPSAATGMKTIDAGE